MPGRDGWVVAVGCMVAFQDAAQEKQAEKLSQIEAGNFVSRLYPPIRPPSHSPPPASLDGWWKEGRQNFCFQVCRFKVTSAAWPPFPRIHRFHFPSHLERVHGERPLVVCERLRQHVRVEVEVKVDQVAQQPAGLPVVLLWVAHL